MAVDRVPVAELLFALARDADIDVDIVGEITGTVTLNAVDETLPRLLERIALQAPIRYELGPGHLEITHDAPYLQTYPVPYVNLARRAETSIETATRIGSTGFSADGGAAAGARDGNNSSTVLTNESDNRFWRTLERNLRAILGAAVTGSGDAPGAERYVIANRETGYVTVRATRRQQRAVRAYIERVVASARRQVLIEATVVEVELAEAHEAGVDWRYLSSRAGGVDLLEQNLLGGALGQPPNVLARIADPDVGRGGAIQATIRALSTFGDVRVVSSPKIMALNNQMSVLKVVDNRVYFTLDVSQVTDEGQTRTTFETQVNTVPVGLVMTVTPYVGEGREVVLNVRPTVSRILGFVPDPNPEFAAAEVTSEVPEIQVREMESLLRVGSGRVAVIGGLMQDRVDETRRSVPGLGRLPLIGGLFSYRSREVEKTELIVFLRPTVITEPGLEADHARFGRYLPRRDTGMPAVARPGAAP
ncbi:MAG: pilus (MSHA type) biogenesis protein MshL [Halofilum sp. (in: g-proteobacteria)]|nr:pilus (MSHA type) biogenesis protein MshL [Halofilum sp. (in: g-proteobacteria)]